MLGIESGLATCKVNALHSMLLLRPTRAYFFVCLFVFTFGAKPSIAQDLLLVYMLRYCLWSSLGDTMWHQGLTKPWLTT